MTDWNRLKVADLKVELKKRGLPQNGLKAELVARLRSSDENAGSESEATLREDPIDTTPSPDVTLDSPSKIEPTPMDDGLNVLRDQNPQTQISSQDALPQIVSGGSVSEAQATDAVPSAEANTSPAVMQDTIESSLPPVEPQEAIDDRQKRKRRSKSPPPSATDISHKRVRQDESPLLDPQSASMKNEVTTSKEDSDWVDHHNNIDSADVNAESREVAQDGTGAEPGPTIVDVAKEEVTVQTAEDSVHNRPEVLNDSTEATEVNLSLDESSGSRSKDARFKDLFSGPNRQASSSDKWDPMDQVDTESDRLVAPSVHPATSALYIRDFMRPLNPTTLREHLIDLATPPGSDPDPEVIAKFFLDPIRTHAFISFKNVSTASRVRSELHGRVWPNERNRKPLWSDFIPPERISEWQVEEEEASGGIRSAAKKWEVVYTADEDGNMIASLQEASVSAAPARTPSITSAPTPVLPPRGIEGAPSGPRADLSSNHRAPAPLPRPNDHFLSTNTKPTLYYEPVSKSLANKRLDNLDLATAKHHDGRGGAEINRYTFEDGAILVDRGPEIFSGIRPPPRTGGGRGGGFGGDRFRRRGGDRYEGRPRDDSSERKESSRALEGGKSNRTEGFLFDTIVSVSVNKQKAFTDSRSGILNCTAFVRCYHHSESHRVIVLDASATLLISPGVFFSLLSGSNV
ncbi:MAG: hypothetical protein M1818_001067 [Claussenomyces sp. TS43310]|nr:MAG: hypothetical protein M1818_001067 [Claussenomyces sp. TS43310]